MDIASFLGAIALVSLLVLGALVCLALILGTQRTAQAPPAPTLAAPEINQNEPPAFTSEQAATPPTLAASDNTDREAEASISANAYTLASIIESSIGNTLEQTRSTGLTVRWYFDESGSYRYVPADGVETGAWWRSGQQICLAATRADAVLLVETAQAIGTEGSSVYACYDNFAVPRVDGTWFLGSTTLELTRGR